jgi:lipid II:glycine glycyltransferase (peptidoglycan interpeptide bridge formation enzyme)
MLITERNFSIFKILNIYFLDEPMTEKVPDCDVVTYHTYKNWGEINGFERRHNFATTIDLRKDIDDIWNKIKRQNKRHIRRAEKNGTRVTISNNYDEFYDIYNKFLKRKKYADRFGINVLSQQYIQKYGILFIAENKGEIIGGGFYFHDKKNALLMDIAYQNFENTSENKKLSIDANCYIHWEAMQHFKKMGISSIDLGDVSTDLTKITRQMNGGDYFKRSFGGEVISRYQYRKFNNRFHQLVFNSWNFLQTQK